MQLSVVSQNFCPLVLILRLSKSLSRRCFLLLWLRDSLLDDLSLTLAAIENCHARFLHGIWSFHSLGDVKFSSDTLFKLFESVLCELMVALSLSDKCFYLSFNDRVHLREIEVSVDPLRQEVLDLRCRFIFPPWRGSEARLGIVLAESSSKVSHK